MTPARIRACLAIIGWSQLHFAWLVRRQYTQVRRWTSGATGPLGPYKMPEELAEWLERVAEYHKRNPPPTT